MTKNGEDVLAAQPLFTLAIHCIGMESLILFLTNRMNTRTNKNLFFNVFHCVQITLKML